SQHSPAPCTSRSPRRPTTSVPATRPLRSRTRKLFSPAPPPPRIYTLSLHDALPISSQPCSASVDSSACQPKPPSTTATRTVAPRSEEHTSELQSRENLVCRLLLEKKKEHQITPATLPNREARADATLPRYVHAGACG